MGHMELQTPVYNPLMFLTMMKIAKYKCLCCHRVRMFANGGHLLAAHVDQIMLNQKVKIPSLPHAHNTMPIVQDESSKRPKIRC